MRLSPSAPRCRWPPPGPRRRRTRRCPARTCLPTSQDLRLLRRATYGPTPDSLAALRRQGRASWLDGQLDPRSIDDSACERLVAERFPQLGWGLTEALRKADPIKHDFQVWLGMAALARAAWSRRQLFEVMVDFWSNHLNVTTPAVTGAWYCRNHYDRTVIRRHALGRFEDMLVASARHPAMLLYLNNADSTKSEPNENYGRELLELHTLGVDGGYTETDMYQSTLIMTGFGIDRVKGVFRYYPEAHHVGPVDVMGFHAANDTAAGGQAVGVAYLRYLANHPSTASHLARKLCVRFVSDEPDPALVDRLAQTYLANGTAIAPVLRELFDSQDFADSVGEKVRRPMEDVVATLRILGYRPPRKGIAGLSDLYYICNQFGHAPYAWAQPDGYPDDAVAWQSAGATLFRWNRHLSMAGHWYPSRLPMPALRSLLPRRLPRTHGDLVDVLAKRLVFRTLRPEHQQVVLDFLEKQASDPLTSTSAAVTWRLAGAVALVLDSPYHGMR